MDSILMSISIAFIFLVILIGNYRHYRAWKRLEEALEKRIKNTERENEILCRLLERLSDKSGTEGARKH